MNAELETRLTTFIQFLFQAGIELERLFNDIDREDSKKCIQLEYHQRHSGFVFICKKTGRKDAMATFERLVLRLKEKNYTLLYEKPTRLVFTTTGCIILNWVTVIFVLRIFNDTPCIYLSMYNLEFREVNEKKVL